MSLINQIKPWLGVSVVTLSFSTPVLAAPTADIVGGVTSVQLSNELVQALGTLKVQPAVVGKSKLNRGVASFPITGGAIDLGTVKTEIIHQGGLSLSTSKVKVELTDFAVTTLADKPVLTGLVTVNGNLLLRAPLFDLGLPKITPPLRPTTGKVVLTNVKLTLTSEAAGLLNPVFGVTAFSSGFNIGTARVQAIAH